MKKIFFLFLGVAIIFLLSACSGESKQIVNSNVNSKNQLSAAERSNSKKKMSNILIVYFSCTGNTAHVASDIAKITGGDLFEIVPKQKYTDADLDYIDTNSRVCKEHSGQLPDPEIESVIKNLDQYDTIYIGYPIWWAEAPTIMRNFIKSYDFTGKRMIPFATSVSTGLCKSGVNLEKICKGKAKWDVGKRFGEHPSFNEVEAWVKKVNK